MSRDLYIEAYESLCRDQDDEPTDEQVEEKMVDLMADAMDHAMNNFTAVN